MTSTPWRLKTYSQFHSLKRSEIYGPVHPVDGGDYAAIAQFANDNDAKFALVAVNTHETLVSALRNLLEVSSCANDCAEDDMTCATQAARAVLKKLDELKA